VSPIVPYLLTNGIVRAWVGTPARQREGVGQALRYKPQDISARSVWAKDERRHERSQRSIKLPRNRRAKCRGVVRGRTP